MYEVGVSVIHILDDDKQFKRITANFNDNVTVFRTLRDICATMKMGTDLVVDYLLLDGYLGNNQTGLDYIDYLYTRGLLKQIKGFICISNSPSMNHRMKVRLLELDPTLSCVDTTPGILLAAETDTCMTGELTLITRMDTTLDESN